MIGHILRFARPLCGFSNGEPKDWPLRHYWVHDPKDLPAVVHGKEDDVVVKLCEPCGTEFKRLQALDQKGGKP